MTMEKKHDGKCCLCVELKTACYIIAYSLAVVHTTLLLTVTYTILTTPSTLSLNDPEEMKKLMTVLAFGQIAFPICVMYTKFTIILLVGLHVKSILRIKLYLIFATCMAVITTITGFAMEFLLHIELAASTSVLLNLFNAYFIHTIWRYLKQIVPKNIKVLKETV